MNLREKLIKLYRQEFAKNKIYLNQKLLKINNCKSDEELYKLSQELDKENLEILSKL